MKVNCKKILLILGITASTAAFGYTKWDVTIKNQASSGEVVVSPTDYEQNGNPWGSIKCFDRPAELGGDIGKYVRIKAGNEIKFTAKETNAWGPCFVGNSDNTVVSVIDGIFSGDVDTTVHKNYTFYIKGKPVNLHSSYYPNESVKGINSNVTLEDTAFFDKTSKEIIITISYKGGGRIDVFYNGKTYELY
ncbi:MAG: hypothetical protein K0R14_897 [Burkholderiales bacterium]|jgi:hypothetical protein|nr:hypothetical protein [Burkholderiales bacterium]